MCGRFTITVDRVEEILKHFNAEIAPDFDEYKPRYNAAPTQMLPAIASKENVRYLTNAFWGFVPPWSEGELKKSYQINIRDDTILKNKFFHDRLINNRCIFPANGFYEWKSIDITKNSPKQNKKVPYYISLKNNKLFALAGLWRTIKIEDKIILSAAIITTRPNKLISNIHNRMPVILDEKELELWLHSDFRDFKKLHELLDPYPEDEMQYYAVSTIVNNGRFDSPECIEPAI